MAYFSHSRISTYKQCPYKYKLKYLDELRTIFNQDACNPLVLGSAMHLGIEKSVDEALNYYKSQYAVISDENINEMIKLEIMINKARDFLKDYRDKAQFELQINIDDYLGYVDMLVDNGDGTHDLLDFKYSNNIENYKNSDQLDIYQYYLELQGYNIRNSGYVIIPKVYSKQKKDEDLFQFRNRIINECNSKKILLVKHEYNYNNVVEFLETKDKIDLDKEFVKSRNIEICLDLKTTFKLGKYIYKTIQEKGNCFKCEFKATCKLRLCDYCEFKEYCKRGETYMILPENKRSEVKPNLEPDMWIYAQSYVGKTYFMDQFDDNLFLNTDGNIDNITSPVLRITDTYNGRIKKWAWTNFVETIDELEKKENTFKVITIDLLEDVLEHCRAHIFNREGWKHESDGGYGKGWDMVKTEFLNQIKRLKNCGYRIVFISKEIVDEVTLKNGTKITKYKPNIRDVIANVLTGTVDITMRAYADGDERFLSFKTDEYTFGGGRINFNKKEIPLNKEAFDKILVESQSVVKSLVTEEVKEEEKIEGEPDKNPELSKEVKEEPKKRSRRKRD